MGADRRRVAVPVLVPGAVNEVSRSWAVVLVGLFVFSLIAAVLIIGGVDVGELLLAGMAATR
jgi:hypothetical protein